MSSDTVFKRFTGKWVIPAITLSMIYWFWFGLFVGVDAMTILFFFGVLILFFGTASTRKLAIGFSPFFVYLVLYSSLKVLHKHMQLPVHIEDLYFFELKLFGVNFEGARVTLCEYFNHHQSKFFDIISGIAYITWVPIPIIFGFVLFFNEKHQLLFNFWLCFLIANIFGFIGYLGYPAAAPWYYFEYGNHLIPTAPSSAAGLLRFDELIGFPLYANMYSAGTNTFGAMPSMHAAFPLILVYFSRKYGNQLLTGIFLLSLLGIWFGAVYSNHHYVIDLVAGIFCAILAIIITESIVNRKFVADWYDKTMNYIS